MSARRMRVKPLSCNCGRWSVEMFALAYDWERAARRALDKNRPERGAHVCQRIDIANRRVSVIRSPVALVPLKVDPASLRRPQDE